MDRIIHEHYGIELFDWLSSCLLGISKTIGSIKAQANVGKSTLSDILMLALPEAITTHNAKGVFNRDGQRFTPLSAGLSRYLILMVDEAGHADVEITTSQINECVQNSIDLERKYEQRKTVRRIGSIVMMGHEWPRVNYSDQGISERFQWCYEVDNDDDDSESTKMDGRKHIELMQDDQIAYLRAWLFHRASELWNKYESTQSAKQNLEEDPTIQDHVNSMSETRSDPLCMILRENFKPWKNGCVASSEIKEVIEENLGSDEEEVDIPKGKSMKSLMERAFPGSVRSGRKSGQSVWFGICRTSISGKVV